MPKRKPTPSVEDKPYVVTRLPYGEPTYKAKFTDAVAVINKDLADMKDDARRYCSQQQMDDVDALYEQVRWLSPWQRGPQRIEGEVRGLITVTYCAEIRRREEF
jgi:hypothetical protein